MGLKRGCQGTLFEGKRQQLRKEKKKKTERQSKTNKTKVFCQKGLMKKRKSKDGILKGKTKEKEEEEEEEDQEKEKDSEERAFGGAKEQKISQIAGHILL